MNPPERIAFVGVGRMGGNMARRLRDCGHPITAVFDTNAAAARDLAAELGAESCATLTPAVHGEVERRARAAGALTLEGCMASSIPQARNGTLYLMCGGERPTFDRVRPVLERLSTALRYIGPTGSAAQVKALVNMVMNCNTAALAEGLGLGQALGLDLDMLREGFAQTGANSQVLKTDGEDMQHRAHDCFFSAAHAAKDSGIADQLARDCGLDLPLGRATREQYDRMVAFGLGHLDKSGIAELTFRERHP